MRLLPVELANLGGNVTDAVARSVDGHACMNEEARGIVHEVLHRDQDVVPLAQVGVRERELGAGVLLVTRRKTGGR